MKKIISIIPIIAIIAVISFALPNQAYAAWWNPFSWFSQNEQIEKQGQTQSINSSNTAPELQTASQDVGETEQQNAPVPLSNTQSSDTKTIKDLQADIVLLTNGLSELLKAHNNLVNNHNELTQDFKSILQVTAAFRNELKDFEGNNLESRTTSLENKIENVCNMAFTHTITPLPGVSWCPSGSFFQESLESRIKKLERGY